MVPGGLCSCFNRCGGILTGWSRSSVVFEHNIFWLWDRACGCNGHDLRAKVLSTSLGKLAASLAKDTWSWRGIARDKWSIKIIDFGRKLLIFGQVYEAWWWKFLVAHLTLWETLGFFFCGPWEPLLESCRPLLVATSTSGVWAGSSVTVAPVALV